MTIVSSGSEDACLVEDTLTFFLGFPWHGGSGGQDYVALIIIINEGQNIFRASSQSEISKSHQNSDLILYLVRNLYPSQKFRKT